MPWFEITPVKIVATQWNFYLSIHFYHPIDIQVFKFIYCIIKDIAVYLFDSWPLCSQQHTDTCTGQLHPHTWLHSGMASWHTRWYLYTENMPSQSWVFVLAFIILYTWSAVRLFHCYCIYLILCMSLLVWQLDSVYPATHWHVKPSTRSVQVAPFWHGELAHSLISAHTKRCCHRAQVQKISLGWSFWP